MNKIKYTKSRWVSFIFVVSIISALVSLYEVNNENYNLMWTLPVSYGGLTIIFRKIYENPTYEYGVGFWSINIVMMIRYVVTPMAIVFTNVYGRIGPTPTGQYFVKAYMLMIYEIICVFCIIRLVTLCVPKYKSKLPEKENDFFNNNYIIISIFLALVFVVLMKYPGSIVPNNLFVISTEGGESLSQYKGNGTINTLKTAFKITFFLTAISILNKRYKKDNRSIWAVLSLGVLFAFLGMLTGSSRWAIVLNSVIGTYILLQLYPKLRYPIIVSIGSLVIVSFVSISIYKFYYMLGDSENQVGVVIEKMFTMFEDYFSGPRLVAQSVEMTQIYRKQLGFSTLINEFVTPIPFIHKLLSNPDNLCNLYFNYYNVGYDEAPWLIIPMIGEGYSVVGYFFAPIFTVLCEGVGVYFDHRATITSAYELKYIYIYTSIWSSLCMGLCSQIIFTWYMGSFLAIYILFKLNRKICL